MANGWHNHEPAPIEFLHGKLQDLFHEWRRTKTENTDVEINGIEFNNLIAKAKALTYEKYPKQVNSNPIPKTEL